MKKKGLLLLLGSIFTGFVGLLFAPNSEAIAPAVICGFLAPSIICFGNRLWYKNLFDFLYHQRAKNVISA